MAKERFQNATCGDTINLRLFTYNSNDFRNVNSIENVKIYYLDPTNITEDNTDGRRLVATIDGDDVENTDTGQYSVSVELSSPTYVIGKYIDIWSVLFEDEECAEASIENNFQIFPDLWLTSPTPIVYDFSFSFRPNRIVKGSKRYIVAEIIPNIPRGTDLTKFYENLAIVSDLRISIAIKCGDCVPAESDLRTIVDRELVDFREMRLGYYMLDTADMDCGIYDVWFELSHADSVFVSEKQQLQIFA